MNAFPTRAIATVYHVAGRSGPGESGEAGRRGAACCMPVDERMPEATGPTERVWRLARADGRFLDFDALGVKHNAEVMRWGVEMQLARHAKAWQVKAWDGEARAWRSVRCTDPRKAGIVLTEPFMSRRSVEPLSWFVATPALEAWYRERVLPDAALGVLCLKYAADVLGCDGAFRRRESGSRELVLFTQHLARWRVAKLDPTARPAYAPRGATAMGGRLDAWC